MKQEIVQKRIKPISGGMMLAVDLILTIFFILLIVWGAISMTGLGIAALIAGILGVIICCLLLCGLRVVRPNEALVLTLFGKYYGTILEPGFYFVNPFAMFNSPSYEKAREKAKAEAEAKEKKWNGSDSVSISAKKTISLKAMALNNGTQKVNDVLGNPIVIGAVVIWKVVNPTKAVFQVEDYVDFISIQTDSTIRNIARLYPYDTIENEDDEQANEKTLRGSSQEIADSMKAELETRVECAGLEIEEVRITHLSYAEEIAAAMLQRQQAAAVISAKQKIVDGAVGMVKMAIDKLGEEEIVMLDEERKAAMVSNLLVILCSGKETQPIVNSGSIY